LVKLGGTTRACFEGSQTTVGLDSSDIQISLVFQSSIVRLAILGWGEARIEEKQEQKQSSKRIIQLV
jgi:hypothetical protein